MRKTFFFQYDVKPEHRREHTGPRTIDVLIEFTGATYERDGRPIVFTSFPFLKNSDLIVVTNWMQIIVECDKIGEAHFAEEAREEKLRQARAILNEYENPVLERMAPAY